MPIWITESADKFVIDLVAELNVAEHDLHSSTNQPAAAAAVVASTHNHLVNAILDL